MRPFRPYKKMKRKHPINCRMQVEGDILTITINLAERHGLTGGSQKRQAKRRPDSAPIMNLLVAQLVPPQFVQDGKGGYRKEIISLSCYIEEEPPMELTEELADKILNRLGRGDAPFSSAEGLAAVSEALKGYPKRLIDLYETVKEAG